MPEYTVSVLTRIRFDSSEYVDQCVYNDLTIIESMSIFVLIERIGIQCFTAGINCFSVGVNFTFSERWPEHMRTVSISIL